MRRIPRAIRCLLALLVPVMLLVSACGGDDSEDSGPTTSREVAQTTTTQSPTTERPTITSTIQATTTTTVEVSAENYDATPGAHDRFIMTWEYQTVEQQDLGKGDAVAYSAGKTVCNQMDIHATFGEVEQLLQSQYGYTFSGAQAVIAGAVRDLCPEYGDTYLTAFDTQIMAATETIVEQSGVHVDVVDVGMMAKRVCTYLDTRTDAFLKDEVIDQGVPKDVNDGRLAPPKLVVRQVVRQWCPGHLNDLNPWWFDDSLPFES